MPEPRIQARHPVGAARLGKGGGGVARRDVLQLQHGFLADAEPATQGGVRREDPAFSVRAEQTGRRMIGPVGPDGRRDGRQRPLLPDPDLRGGNRGLRAWPHQCPHWCGQCLGKLLASATDRWVLREEPAKHGRLPGGSAGRVRGALLQVVD